MNVSQAKAVLLNALGVKSSNNKLFSREVLRRFEPFYEWYLTADASDQAVARSGLSDSECQRLGAYAISMAVSGWQQRNEKYLRMGLLALAVEDARHDYRYTIGKLSMIHHIAQQLGVDPDELFTDAEAMAGKDARSYITSFRRQTPRAKEIKWYGFEVVQTGEGPDFKYVDPPFPDW